MKDLSTYLECDGATPSTVMGAGNPMAPDGEVPGSGDTFNHQKKTAKAKRRRKDVRTDDKKHQEDIVQPATEGLLDADFGMDDSFDSVIIDSMLDKFAAIRNGDDQLTERQYNDFYEQFRTVAKTLHAQFEGVSLMKAFRSKDYTIISFKEKTNCLVSKSLNYVKGIEIRKFVKNPLPWGIEVAWHSNGFCSSGISKRCNHPTTMNIKLWDAYIAPADVWDKLMDRLNYNPFA